jgi:hypothetical protein
VLQAQASLSGGVPSEHEQQDHEENVDYDDEEHVESAEFYGDNRIYPKTVNVKYV